MCLWRPDSRGYTLRKEHAGIYNPEEAREIEDTGNIPILKLKLDRLFITSGIDPMIGEGVPNCSAVWEELNLKWSATGLRKKEVKHENL